MKDTALKKGSVRQLCQFCAAENEASVTTRCACTDNSHLMRSLYKHNGASDRISSFDSWKTCMQERYTLKHAEQEEIHGAGSCVDVHVVYAPS